MNSLNIIRRKGKILHEHNELLSFSCGQAHASESEMPPKTRSSQCSQRSKSFSCAHSAVFFLNTLQHTLRASKLLSHVTYPTRFVDHPEFLCILFTNIKSVVLKHSLVHTTIPNIVLLAQIWLHPHINDKLFPLHFNIHRPDRTGKRAEEY